MSLQKIHLRKLLQLFDAADGKRRALLRADIRDEMASAAGAEKNGGDFYAPFWSDAKQHMGGASDLKLTTAARIELNKGRERLYPELRDGFLLWWNKKRRWINEPFEPLEEKIGIP